jgi:amino acid adenylation domain-containing protein
MTLNHPAERPAVIRSALTLKRIAADGSAEAVDYHLPSGRVGPGGAASTDAGVVLPFLPLRPDGAVDTELLSRAAVPDAPTLRAAEDLALNALAGAARVCAVGHLQVRPERAWHLAELLPDWQRAALRPGTGGDRSSVSVAADPDARPALSDGGPLNWPADAPGTLNEWLLRAAADTDGGLLLIDDEGRSTELGYAELLAQALAMLGGLRAAGLVAGDHVVLALRRHADFFPCFWACLLGGVVAVPVGVPTSFAEGGGAVLRLQQALEMFEQPVVVGDAHVLSGLVQRAASGPWPAHRALDVQQLRGHSPAAPEVVQPQQIALMMLTSGSTGRPKGVPQPHRNLVARGLGSAQFNGFPRGLVSLNWMPLDHVAGLIYFHLRDVMLCGRQIHVSGEAVLRSPLLWLDLLDRHRVQVTFAPNFAFGLVAAEADALARRRLDLSPLRWVLNGGEAIVAAPTRRFLRLLAPHGLRDDAMVPAWGMSEICSGVTYETGFRLDTTSDDDGYVQVGRPLPGVRLRVVGEDGELLREGQVGQLQVDGVTVFGGYHGTQHRREDTFTADGWFRTGDLARLDDGHLTITGRDKDVIIINGANYAGPAIEAAVDELPGVQRSYTAAGAVADPQRGGAEGLVLFFAPEAGADDAALEALLRAIRQKVQRTFGITPAVLVPLSADQIPKTSIGKIQRGALQKALQAGAFEAALRRADVVQGNADTLPRWFFQRRWQRVPGAPVAIDPQTPLLLVGEPEDDLLPILQGHFARSRLVASAAPFDPGPARELVWLAGSADDSAAACAAVAAALAMAARCLADGSGPSRLLVVTRRAAAVAPGEKVAAAHAPFGALVQTLAQEHPGLSAAVLDLDDAPAPQQLQRIGDALLGADAEVAWRGSGRYLPLLQPLDPRAGAGAGLLRRGGRYLIGGGLGGIGVLLAEWLLVEWQAEVLLLSRKGVPTAEAPAHDLQAAARRAAWQRLQAASTRPQAVQLAQAAPDDAAAIAQALRNWPGSIDAAFHLAGSYREGALAQESPQTLETVLGPKVEGFKALRSVLPQSVPLVAFSSVTSLFGGATVGAYAAANRWLEAQAGCGPNWVIAWGSWQDTGLTRRFGAREPLRAMGVQEMAPVQALQSLRVLLCQPAGAYVAGLSGSSAYVARRSCGQALETVVSIFAEGPAASPPGLPTSLNDRFGAPARLQWHAVAALPLQPDGQPDRGQLIQWARQGGPLRMAANPTEARLVELWRRVLGLQVIDVEASFFELGGQSLLASQLVAAIGGTFGVAWSLRDVFEAPTVRSQALRLAAAAPAAESDAARPGVRGAAMPLGSAQTRLWFLHQMLDGSAAFNIPASIRFARAPDSARVQRALQAVLQRHDSLRTRFPLVDGQPVQLVDPALEFELTTQRVADRQALEVLAEQQARQPFDLEHGPLLRCCLALLADGSATLLLAVHHIVADGASMKVLFSDWLQAFRSDRPLPAAVLQYADFAAWQRREATAPRRAEQIAYWRGRLGDNTEGFTLPTDLPRPPAQRYRGAMLRSRMPAALSRNLRALARRQGVTLFVMMLAAYQALLARYAQQHDVLVGTVLANRDQPAFEPLIGFIVNLVVIRTGLHDDPRFVDVLRRVHEAVLDAYAHHELPFEALVEELQPRRDTSRAPLFQVAFDLRDPEITRCPEPGIEFGIMEPELGAAQHDLHLTLEQSHDAEPVMTAVWQYSTDLFRPGTIDRLARNFETLLEGIVAQPEQRLSRLSLLHAQERALLAAWGNRAAPFPRGLALHQLFEAHVDRQPQQLALVHGGQRLSYAEVEARSNAWAHALQASGVGRDVPVGICLERSVDLVLAMLATLKAGGAFLPLDPTYPQARLAHMVADAGIGRLLTSTALAPRFEAERGAGLQLLCVDAELSASAGPTHRPACTADARSLAYVIYTSGSTGLPKGVLVEHRGWCNVAQAQQDLFGLRPGMRVLQFASASFDACAFELAMALASGGTLVMGSAEDLMPGPALARLLQREQVQVVTLPPTALAALPEDTRLPSLEVVTVAGEACPPALVQRWAKPPVRFFNLYGPTEATIWSTLAACRSGDDRVPPIGGPVPNVSLQVLDAQRQALPLGMPGELCIGGVGVARGYHRRPELNAERFIDDPAEPGARLYCSGDIVRWVDGELEFLGRGDHQVKLRGLRIELGEVESALRDQPGVAEALVLLHGTGVDAALVAYVIPRPGAQPEPAALRAELQSRLPRHMVPNWVIALPQFPLTPNGKVDRARLPAPLAQGGSDEGPLEPPSGDLERIIAAIWCEVLGLPAVDRNQNFFDAGGHSIKMARVHSQLQRQLPSAPSLVELFQYPTVAALAARLASAPGPAATAAAIPKPDAQRLAALAQRQRAARR